MVKFYDDIHGVLEFYDITATFYAIMVTFYVINIHDVKLSFYLLQFKYHFMLWKFMTFLALCRDGRIGNLTLMILMTFGDIPLHHWHLRHFKSKLFLVLNWIFICCSNFDINDILWWYYNDILTWWHFMTLAKIMVKGL